MNSKTRARYSEDYVSDVFVERIAVWLRFLQTLVGKLVSKRPGSDSAGRQPISCTYKGEIEI